MQNSRKRNFHWHKNTLFVKKRWERSRCPSPWKLSGCERPTLKARWHKAAASLPLGGSGIKERCVFPSLALHRSSASSKQRNTRESQSPSLLPPPSSPEDDLFDNVIKCCACSGQQRHLQTSSTSEKQQWAFVAKFYRRWIYLFISLVMTPFFLQFISNMFILFLCLVWNSSKDNEHYEMHSKCVRAQSSSV